MGLKEKTPECLEMATRALPRHGRVFKFGSIMGELEKEVWLSGRLRPLLRHCCFSLRVLVLVCIVMVR